VKGEGHWQAAPYAKTPQHRSLEVEKAGRAGPTPEKHLTPLCSACGSDRCTLCKHGALRKGWGSGGGVRGSGAALGNTCRPQRLPVAHTAQLVGGRSPVPCPVLPSRGLAPAHHALLISPPAMVGFVEPRTYINAMDQGPALPVEVMVQG
jgi:hypothetical protein